MILKTMNEIKEAEISAKLKEYLMKKFTDIITAYHMEDIEGVLAVVLIEDAEYVKDKLLEFCEVMTFGKERFIHSVWAASNNYSEDIYILYSNENMIITESRCSSV